MFSLDFYATLIQPYPYSTALAEPPKDQIALGKYLTNAVYNCANCHSADFKSNNELDLHLFYKGNA
jgi:cytochrome c553